MDGKFLFQRIIEEFGKQTIREYEIPKAITDNLNSRFKIRRYQREAFTHFLLYFEGKFQSNCDGDCCNSNGERSNTHLLFNMATGSGKTLIMAGLILHLYEKGYRNFLFFVNSTNILVKTKDNFLNPASAKYLFAPGIHLDNRKVDIAEVDSFEGVNSNDINICFTTIQGLHSDLENVKENSLVYDDFKSKKTVLLADEAHHLNVETKSKTARLEQVSWENTVEQILESNPDNLLLEFTATHDYEKPAMIDKYRYKIIFRYDLRSFRGDRFSKEIMLVESALKLKFRILQAIIISYYKQLIAAKHKIRLKPVLLFKSQKTIAQSQQLKIDFHDLIDGLTVNMIESLRRSQINTLKEAFQFFAKENINDQQLAQRLKAAFKKEHCLSVNDEKEKESYQVRLNTLEDRENPIRAIFAVQKLNEGWDVLNLFDIVRCYETRDSNAGKIGKTTLAEAQLIGRGARYFPFVIEGNDDMFRRKFDSDTSHELRILEELHYHSINDHRYLSELREALSDEGLLDKEAVECPLKLKKDFKQTKFYEEGVIWLNDRRERNYQSIKSLKDMHIDQQPHEYTVASGRGREVALMKNRQEAKSFQRDYGRRVTVAKIGSNIVFTAIACNPFFWFSSIKRYFPHLASIEELVMSKDYLGNLELKFYGNPKITEGDKLEACCELLNLLEEKIRSQHTDHEGTRRFRRKEKIKAVFTDKQLKIRKDRLKEDAEVNEIVANEDWYAFDTDYGTSEEKSFVKMMYEWIERQRHKYQEIYLLRNEKHFKIYNFADGKAFQPDFVLHLKKKNGRTFNYQLFIEPKGGHLLEHDRWKEKFLKAIKDSSHVVGETDDYRLIGLPFFNSKQGKKFIKELDDSLAEKMV